MQDFMNEHEIESYCLSKRGATKEYPFDLYVAVYKVGNKMFALSKDFQSPLQINLKCNPRLGISYSSVFYSYDIRELH